MLSQQCKTKTLNYRRFQPNSRPFHESFFHQIVLWSHFRSRATFFFTCGDSAFLFPKPVDLFFFFFDRQTEKKRDRKKNIEIPVFALVLLDTHYSRVTESALWKKRIRTEGPKRGGCEGKGVQTQMMLQTPRISTPLPDCQSKEKEEQRRWRRRRRLRASSL